MKRETRGASRTPYDPAKDVIIAKLWSKQTGPTRGTRLVLRQYNGGEVKLAYEEVWKDSRSGEIRSKSANRCPAKVLVEAGIATPEIVAAAQVEPARKSDPAPAPADDGADAFLHWDNFVL